MFSGPSPLNHWLRARHIRPRPVNARRACVRRCGAQVVRTTACPVKRAVCVRRTWTASSKAVSSASQQRVDQLVCDAAARRSNLSVHRSSALVNKSVLQQRAAPSVCDAHKPVTQRRCTTIARWSNCATQQRAGQQMCVAAARRSTCVRCTQVSKPASRALQQRPLNFCALQRVAQIPY